MATPAQPDELSGDVPDDTHFGVIGLVRLLAKAAAREAVQMEQGEPSDRDHPVEDPDEDEA